MKRSQTYAALALAAILVLTLEIPGAANAPVQGWSRVKEYENFHDVLHPLEHEALPQGDFGRIRSKAAELVKLGKAIVKLGVPPAPKASRREFAKARSEFDRALTRLRIDAKTGSDIRLKQSYSAVHDSFEKLADLVPTVYPAGKPTP